MGRTRAARLHQIPAVGALLLVLVSTGAGASAVAALDETPLPVDASPSPFVPAALPRTSEDEQGGILVSISLDANPMVAGEPASMTTEVTNTREDAIYWTHNSCEITVWVEGVMDDFTWRHGRTDYGPRLTEFKTRTVGPQEGIPVFIGFRPEAYLPGPIACNDILIIDEIEPGATIRQRLVWDGQVSYLWGPPPDGTVRLAAKGCCFYLDRPDGPLDDPIEFQLALDAQVIEGRDPSWLHPGEVIDAAFLADGFKDMVRGFDYGSGNTGWLRFDVEAGLWEVGVLDFTTDKLRVALVDPVTGEVGDIIKRPWVPAVDGNA